MWDDFQPFWGKLVSTNFCPFLNSQSDPSTLTHAHTHAPTHTHARTHTHTHRGREGHTHAHTHAHTLAPTHTHTLSRPHAHTHTHTHTHQQVLQVMGIGVASDIKAISQHHRRSSLAQLSQATGGLIPSQRQGPSGEGLFLVDSLFV